MGELLAFFKRLIAGDIGLRALRGSPLRFLRTVEDYPPQSIVSVARFGPFDPGENVIIDVDVEWYAIATSSKSDSAAPVVLSSTTDVKKAPGTHDYVMPPNCRFIWILTAESGSGNASARGEGAAAKC